jgi:enoyl-CoA hydratase
VITGRGKIFSAGVDLFRVVDGGRDYVDEFLPALRDLFAALLEFPRPLVAAVNGHAIAGGCVIACGCDRRLASGVGRIGMPELTVGVPFPTVALEMVRGAVGTATARDLVLSGRSLEMTEALHRGLVDRLVEPEDLVDEACAEAERLAVLPPDAYALTRRQLHEPALAAHRGPGREWDEEVIEQWSRPETLERIRGYLDKTVGRKG